MGDEQLREEFLSAEDIYDGAILHVQKWRVRLPDGREALREVVLHKGAAAVVPVDEKGRVTLVRQHRVAAGVFTWEIPAGKLDYAQEAPLACARRELEEETGLRAQRWQKLTDVITTPGFCSEHIHVYLATQLSRHEDHLDEDEFLSVMTMDLKEAVAHVMAGELRDAKTCLGLLMAEKALAERESADSRHLYASDRAPASRRAGL